MDIRFFDVGQGDSCRIRIGDACLWIDYGTHAYGRRAFEAFGAARAGCRHSWFVVSHLDADHVGGLFDLIGVLDIRKLIVAPVPRTGRAAGYDRRIRAAGVRILHAPPQALSPHVDILWPPPAPDDAFNIRNENEASLVIRVWDAARRHCALMTGDISRRVEAEIMRRHPMQTCALLKVAHHGSRNSNSAPFLAWTRPRIAVISSGWLNSHRHPHRDTMKRFKRAGAFVFETRWMGRIDVRLEEKKAVVKSRKGAISISL